MAFRQSVCVPMVFGAPVLEAGGYERLRDMGFDGVEFWEKEGLGDYRDAFARARVADLAIASFCGHRTDPARGLNNGDLHPALEKELAESIRLAAEYAVPGIICLTGNLPEGMGDREGRDNCVRILEKMAPLAEREGVNLNVELLNSRIDHRGYQCDRTAWGAELCRAVDSERVRLLYDIYHMQIMEGDIIRTIGENLPLIGHFHTAGVPGRADMDDTQELNYRAIAAAIDRSEYSLFVGHEYRPRGDVWESLEKTAEIFS